MRGRASRRCASAFPSARGRTHARCGRRRSRATGRPPGRPGPSPIRRPTRARARGEAGWSFRSVGAPPAATSGLLPPVRADRRAVSSRSIISSASSSPAMRKGFASIIAIRTSRSTGQKNNTNEASGPGSQLLDRDEHGLAGPRSERMGGPAGVRGSHAGRRHSDHCRSAALAGPSAAADLQALRSKAKMRTIRYAWPNGVLELVRVEGTNGRPYRFGEGDNKRPIEETNLFCRNGPGDSAWGPRHGCGQSRLRHQRHLPLENVSGATTRPGGFLQLLDESPIRSELSTAAALATGSFRLPSETEWVMRCGGPHWSDDFRFSGSNDVDAVAWYDRRHGDHTQPVGLKRRTQTGADDMSGNVWEWCQDAYTEDVVQIPADGSPHRGEVQSALRGGCFHNWAIHCTVSHAIRLSGSFTTGALACAWRQPTFEPQRSTSVWAILSDVHGNLEALQSYLMLHLVALTASSAWGIRLGTVRSTRMRKVEHVLASGVARQLRGRRLIRR